VYRHIILEVILESEIKFIYKGLQHEAFKNKNTKSEKRKGEVV